MGKTINELLRDELNPYKPGSDIEVNELPALKTVPSIFNKYTTFNYAKATLGESLGTVDFNQLSDKPPEIITSENDSNPSSTQVTSTSEAVAASKKNKTFKASGTDADQLYKTPTAQTIIEYSRNQNPEYSLFGPMPYSWSDFLWSKYYGKITNNNLITLRRYALPIWDNAKVLENGPMAPIAQAISYLGTEPGNKISDILSFDYGIPWKEIEAKVQTVEGNEQGFGAGAEGFLGGRANAAGGYALAAIRGDWSRWSGQQEKEQDWARNSFGSEGPYWNQVLGPVNVIHKTQMREQGLKFSQDIKIKFEYSLRSFENVNPRVAFADLISNFLTLTYNNAKFWGGAMRYFPNAKPQTLFFGDQNAFYSGDWNKYFGSMANGLGNVFEKAGDFLGNLLSGGLNLKSLLGNLKDVAANAAFGNLARKSRPHLLSIRNLLSGDPIGEWHLTVGNPLKPIAMMGNLIVSDVKFKTNDILGADDFPTEISFEVTLKHGRPRDKGDIESMFNFGAGRLSYSPYKTLPSEKGTYGDAFNTQTTKDNNQSSGKDINKQQAVVSNDDATLKDSGKAFAITKSRVSREWSSSFDNANLSWIFNKTKISF